MEGGLDRARAGCAGGGRGSAHPNPSRIHPGVFEAYLSDRADSSEAVERVPTREAKTPNS
jgi:hypothetical protein